MTDQSNHIPTVRIYGIPVSSMNMADTAAYLTDVVERRAPHQIITANPIMLMTALEEPAYHTMMRNAELVVPDGAGLVWAAGYVGQPVAERVAGYDLMHELLRIGNSRNWRVYLLGASPEVVQAASSKLHAQYPGIRIVGVRDGYFKDEQDSEIISAIAQAQPDILFVGRSVAKQEPWIAKYKHQLNVPIMMGIGGSFDVLSGKLKRAPYLFQKLRLEWFYRLLQEPWRYKRMLILPKFAIRVIRDKASVTKS
jgi:N-acetylglucosaminyldiphosphoundecaprenol N-acetyl-beta-D-mannosaminyltransferase